MRKDIILLGIIAAFIFAGCTSPSEQTIRIATSKNLWCALPLVAIENKYFEEEGIEAKVVFTDGGRYCMDALLSNSSDLGTIVETNIGYLGFQENKTIEVVANVVRSNCYAIVARKSSDIYSISDLSDKTLAYAPAMGGEMYASEFITKYNIYPQIRKLQPKALTSAIIGGEIDAVSTWDPFVNAIEKAIGKENLSVFRDSSVFQGYMHLGSRKDFVMQNRSLLQTVFKVLKKAQLFIENNPEKAQEILSEKINLDIGIVRETWKYYDFSLSMNTEELVEITTKVGETIINNNKDYTNQPLPDYSHFYNDIFFNEFMKLKSDEK